MPDNRLIHEKSPYLLQHAHNPVDWYPWGAEAFGKAQAENKPIFLSVGYSTCHWCHVMERESFEDAQIAGIMNRHFINIKVDREERPDVDRIYMSYVQATSGGGGWPMSVWLTPDRKPFVGGTYFPPENRYGRPGFPQILARIAEAWERDREKIIDSSDKVLEQLQKQSEVRASGGVLSEATLDAAFQIWQRSFDSRLGGFGGPPKFPRPVVLNFLLRFYARSGNQEALTMVLETLQAMAKGGIHDQLGGGFHRYAVDEYWFVPHFEKMLYDQAQLATSYLEAFQITKDAQYAAVARDILDYVLRDMTDASGGFYSAEDADSVIDAAHPHEKGEGAFYVWPHAEIELELGREHARWFQFRYGVEEDGNVRNDPHGEFAGHNILFEANTLEETALHVERPIEEVRAAFEAAGTKLLTARAKRVRPHLDDKVLTAWNGLMISAFLQGGAILNEPRYTEAARRPIELIRARLYDPLSGVLMRRYRDGDVAIPGFLDDYAFLSQALIDSYETAFRFEDLELAITLTNRMLDLFEDAKQGGLFSTPAEDEDLVMRLKDDYDGAEPSGNSIAARNLLRLARMTGGDRFLSAAQRILQAFSDRMETQSAAVPQMLVALDYSLSAPREIVIAGEADGPGTQELSRTLQREFVPNKIVLLADDQHREQLATWNPAIAGMRPRAQQTAVYVCENYACQLPVTEPSDLLRLIQ
jgi:uncharacterized protein YyaL (SSP411 family)